MFRRFKEWLTAIYKSVRLLGGLPPKEVQDIMARMLATEEDIHSYVAQQGLDSFENTGLYKAFSEEQQAQWQEKLDTIREKAKEKVMKSYMKEISSEKEKEFETMVPQLETDIQKELVETYPVYQARVRYDAFGEVGLEGTPYPTKEALEKGEQEEALGNMDTVIADRVQAMREEVLAFRHDPKAIQKMAEEHILTSEGMQEITALEAEAIRKKYFAHF